MERSGNFYKAIQLGYILISILIGCMAYNSLYEWQEIEALELGNKIDIYPTLLNLLGLEKFRWSGIGQSILDPRKPGIAISPKRKIDGDTLHISADELLRMQQSQVISDRIIRFDKLKDLR